MFRCDVPIFPMGPIQMIFVVPIMIINRHLWILTAPCFGCLKPKNNYEIEHPPFSSMFFPTKAFASFRVLEIAMIDDTRGHDWYHMNS